MSKYYTAKGDQGTTGILGKERVSKDHPRIQAVGAVDEATEALGFARSIADDQNLKNLIKSIQEDLVQIMSQLVLESPDPDKFPDLDESRLEWVEETISKYERSLPPKNDFILPGETTLSAALGLARVIVRRAERTVVKLKNLDLLSSSTCLPYLNRLSSLCFVLEIHTSNITSSPDRT
jgi:cob(I)alamin adenosyltransferase